MQSKQPIVTINESGITLHTGLSSRQFANAKMGQYVTESGLLVQKISDNKFSAEEFRFTNTKTTAKNKSDEVVLTNESINGKTLLSIMEGDTQEALQTLDTLNAIIEWSFVNKIKIPNCGPEGTIVTENGILFLPFELFERSILAQNKETTSLFYGIWTNTALNEKDSWRFTLSTYAYKILSNQVPFTELNIEKRSEDYYDSNFIPLQFLVYVPSSVSQIINHNLSITGSAHLSIKPRKESKKNLSSRILETNKQSEENSIALPLQIANISIQKVDSQTEQEKNSFITKTANQLKKKRFIRKHKTSIALLSLTAVFVAVIVGSIIQSNLTKPTTKGMTSIEVVQTFYNAINTLDNVQLDMCGKKSAVDSYSNMVSTVYVSGKIREAYERTIPHLPPAQWISTANPTSHFMFGITNLDIQNKKATSSSPTIGDTALFTADFYLVASQGLDHYEVTKTTDTLTLEYGKKEWQIVSLNSNKNQIPVDSTQFIEDAIITRELIKEDSTIELHEQGILLTETLRETYPWLPTIQEVKASVELIPVYLLESHE